MPVNDYDLLASYAGLLILATTIIYAGAWSSLPKPPQSSPSSLVFEDDDGDEDITERLSSTDAYLFPIIGSFVLGGFYLVFKYFGREWINWLLGIYFSVVGAGSVWRTTIALSRRVLGRSRWNSFDEIKLLALRNRREIGSLSVRTPALLLLIPSAVPSIFYAYVSPRPALLNNILAVSFAHNALSLLKLDGFATGCILLSGLFVYDIWWVFGTTVMVSVATGLDLPIKLLWPKSATFGSQLGYTMLGLGDIVIPGAFITLSLRYDLSRSPQRDPYAPFSKPYFHATMISYVLGLLATMVVMHIFKAAQPALLYLSPACISSLAITALARGELKDVMAWSDEPREPKNREEQRLPHDLEPKPSSKTHTQDVSANSPDDFVNVDPDEHGPSVDADGKVEGPLKRRKGRRK